MGVNGIYGLSGSGLDIESMVKVGMMSKQNEYDKMAQKYTKNEWVKAEYLELNSTIKTFNLSTLSQYKMSSNMNAKSAETNSSAIKVTANGSAPVMSHKVEVTSLSSNAYLIGTHSLSRYTDGAKDSENTSIELKDVLFKSYTISGDKIVNGSVADAELTSTKGLYTEFATGDGVSLDETAFAFTLSDGKNSAEVSYTYNDLFGTDENSAATFNDFVSKINGLGLNVRATYDSINDRFSFYNTEGGAENTIKISISSLSSAAGSRSEVVAKNFLNNLGLYQSIDGELSTNVDANGDGTTDAVDTENYSNPIQFPLGKTTEFTGKSGKIVVDGVKYETTDNKVTVGGITYSALEKTSTAATVTVSQDTDTIIDKVKSFVEDYNKLLSSLYEKYDEKPNTGYEPLTQAQKDAMTDEQIKKWEEKAQEGLLYHDSTLSKIISKIRSAISEPIEGLEGTYNSAYSIGISTTGLKGQLTLDEDKLKAALAADSNAVYNVFATLDSDDDYDSNGIAQRLSDVLNEASKSIKEHAGSTTDISEDSDLNTLLRQLQTKMSNFKKMMNSFEDALYKKYDKMETTLAKLGAQMNFLMAE
ncbi:MAG: flagellar filament capping protein FliD [Selenomonadaceae bacterium]|nr:flagellar filament capping protein FliD [Selenomonadaceae bacterium]